MKQQLLALFILQLVLKGRRGELFSNNGGPNTFQPDWVHTHRVNNRVSDAPINPCCFNFATLICSVCVQKCICFRMCLFGMPTIQCLSLPWRFTLDSSERLNRLENGTMPLESHSVLTAHCQGPPSPVMCQSGKALGLHLHASLGSWPVRQGGRWVRRLTELMTV